MPSITPAEIAVIAAAMLVLYVIPLVLSGIDALRQRRAQALQRQFVPNEIPMGSSPEALAPEHHVEATHAFAAAAAAVQGGADESISPAPQPNGTAAQEGDTAADERQTGSGSLAADRATAECEPAAPVADMPNADRTAEPMFEPFTADAGFQFRLEDLHQVRLPDCATTARTQLWRDGERMAEAHSSAVLAATLLSPYPVRSACLDAVEQDGWKVRLYYLLFPSLWPMSREQAAAQATFEIDTVSGTVTPQMHALRPSDLGEDTRRAIRDIGGEI